MSDSHYPDVFGMHKRIEVLCPLAMRMIVNINDRGISIRRYIVYQTKGSPVEINDRAFSCPPEKDVPVFKNCKPGKVGDEIFIVGAGHSFYS
jgi:hypothetical protein